MEKYKCVEEFQIEQVDGDGFFTNKFKWVKKGSIWSVSDSKDRLIGAEIKLERNNKIMSWIEICKDTLDKCFEKIESAATKEE